MTISSPVDRGPSLTRLDFARIGFFAAIGLRSLPVSSTSYAVLSPFWIGCSRCSSCSKGYIRVQLAEVVNTFWSIAGILLVRRIRECLMSRVEFLALVPTGNTE